MSVCGGSIRSSSTGYSSILKAPSIKSTLVKTPSKVRFRLEQAKNVKRILIDFVGGKNIREYETLVVSIRDAELLDSDICDLLSEATKCISLLRKNVRLFVEALLSFKWIHRSVQVTTEYKSFIINLLCAHNYHARYAIDRLVEHFFIPDNDGEWEGYYPPSVEQDKCDHVHKVFYILIRAIPMCRDLIWTSLQRYFPYHKRSAHVHEYYMYNLIRITSYQPELRPKILHFILAKLVLLDVNAPKESIIAAEQEEEEDMFMMETDDTHKRRDSNETQHSIGHTLDVCMDRLLTHLIVECEDQSSGSLNWDKTKSLYRDIISIFDEIILKTYEISHVQFVMFILCCFKSTIIEAFLNYLWKKVCTPSKEPMVRQAAVSYIASFIARSNFIPLTMVKGTLQQMSEWVLTYISNQDKSNFDLSIHTVFYSVCQGIFYVIAFRQKDLFNSKKGLTFLESLNLSTIVNCDLNPLRVCNPAVVQNFAAVTRTHQLAYCYAKIEHNARNALQTLYKDEQGGGSQLITENVLNSFFPFDPYVLKRSGQKIWPLYIDYKDNMKTEKVRRISDQDMEVDDFLLEQDDNTARMEKFSYGSSPGFRTKA